MAHDGARVRRGDDALVVAIAGGATQEDAATAAGVGRRTVTRRMGDRAFVARVNAARRALVDRALGMMAAEAAGAVRTLADLREDPEVPPAVRRAAARDVLALLVTVGAHEDLEARLEALEASLGDLEGEAGR